MSMLDRKLRRDLLRMKGQAAAIALVVACAVAAYVGSTTTYRALRSSNEEYYDRFAFADVFAELRRAPATLASRIAEIPGSGTVETRIVADGPMNIPDFAEPATAHLVSIPPGGPRLNRLVLLSGRMPEPGSDEALAGETLLKLHHLHLGDAVSVILEGARRTLRIVGTATSPEFIFEIRPGDLLPDDAHFAVFWAPEADLAAAMRMEGAFNNVVLRLAPGADRQNVLDNLDRLLEPYGCLGAYGRDRHVSHRFISDEIRQLQGVAVFMPAVFLGVAAFLLNVAFSRLVGTQREQIAAIKALGYGNAAVGLHFLQLAGVIVLLGTLVGTLAGAWFGSVMTKMYALFYHLPLFRYELDPSAVAAAVLLSLLTAFAGVAGAVRRAVRLPPAEAMRPPAPPRYRATLLERLGLGRLLGPVGRMILRSLGRRPVRALLTAVGVAAAMAILVLGAFLDDSISWMMDLQFRRAQLEDATVTFVEPRDPAVVVELRGLPGVSRVEPFRAVPVVLRAGHRTWRIGILGLPASPALHRISDRGGNLVDIPAAGLMLTDKLADLLHVHPGDDLGVDVLEGTRPRKTVRLAAVVRDLIGLSAYMELDALNRLAGHGPAVSGAFLSVDQASEKELHRRLKDAPMVAGVLLQRVAVASFEATNAQYLLFFTGILVLFAAVISVGVVYNSARVTLAERERELASLRVLGFTRGEVSAVLLGELAVLVVLALPLGCLFGVGFSALIARNLSSDLFRVPLVVENSTFAFAALVVLGASLLTALAVRRRIDRLDLVEVLKTKE
ncbi:MAG: FtsX-like permease family protein [Deltaproteobacteria bacterium]|nr:FtsX-like permease family protein [Deltaproteobacteria bacterium]